MLLLAVALLVWQLAGRAAAQRDPSLRLRCRRKGSRPSDVTIGVRLLACGDVGPPLTPARPQRLLELPTLRRIAGRTVGGT